MPNDPLHSRIAGFDSITRKPSSGPPPCAWCLEPKDLEARLKALEPRLGGEQMSAWREHVVSYRRAMERHAEGAVDRCESKVDRSVCAKGGQV